MNDTISAILSSSNIVSTPISETLETPSLVTDAPMPPIADMLGATAFYQPSASEVFSPEMLSEARGKLYSIESMAREELGEKASDQNIRELLARIITDQELQGLKPGKLMEKLFVHLSLRQKAREVKKLKEMLRV